MTKRDAQRRLPTQLPLVIFSIVERDGGRDLSLTTPVPAPLHLNLQRIIRGRVRHC